MPSLTAFLEEDLPRALFFSENFFLIAGVCMTASAYHGIRGMEIVSYISVPLIILLGGSSMTAAMSGAAGFSDLFVGISGELPVLTGIGLVIGSFISGGTTTPNFTHFASKRKSAVITSVIAFFLGNSLMFLFGAVGGAFTGKEDIFYVMTAQGLLIPALLVLGANIWTTNDNALYSAGLGLSNITGVRKAPMVVAAGALIGNFVHHGISSINAIIAACVCYSVSAFAAHSKINRIFSDPPQCRTLS